MASKPQSLPKLTGLYIRNLAANLIGNIIIVLLNIVTPLDFLKDWLSFLSGGGWVVIPIFIITACTIVTILQYLIQRPISRYLTCLGRAEKIQKSVELKAGRRLLNLPVLLGLANLCMWLFLDIILTPVMFALLNMTLISLFYNFFRILMIGLIASFISFFLIDDFVREKMVPVLFPEGQRAHLPGNLSRMMSDVNRQLLNDVEDSGNFMTLFYLRLDPSKRCLSWIRAGHDPAIFYNPISDRFNDMHGKGLALGINGQAVFEQNERTGLIPGQIIVLATDGVWEACNKEGDMFGRNPIIKILNQYPDIDANGILTACLFALDGFRDGRPVEDDVSMVVIKVTN